TVRIALVPRLHAFGLGRHSRVFTKKSIVDVVKAVLQEGGLSGGDVTFQVSGSYDAEEHICQYKESDLAFITRGLEQEGMYFFFEHKDGVDKLVITDDKSSHPSLRSGPVRYRPVHSADGSAGESFRQLVCRKRVVPGKIKVKDYDYQNPSLDLSSEGDV